MTQDDVEKRMALLTPTLKLEDLADVDMVIEAVFERMDIKKDVFGKLDKIVKKGAVLASNTSYLNIDEIASVTSRPGRDRHALLLARQCDAALGERARRKDERCRCRHRHADGQEDRQDRGVGRCVPRLHRQPHA